MLALGTRSDAVQVRRARVRGAADALAARRRLERALSDIAPSSLGVARQALLFVRRLAPATRLRLGTHRRTAGFSHAVRSDLERQVQRARRPWLDPDASAAEAVLFADESELAACLLRDWSRGVLADRWWWQAALCGLSPPQWWARHLLGRGDLLPAVLAQLASQGGAVAWVAYLSEDEATQTTAAVIAAHARQFERLAPSAGQELERLRYAAGHIATGARRSLLARVPELQAANLMPAQRRFLALALCLQRASAWTRSAEFATALQFLEAEPVLAAEEVMEGSSTAAVGAPSMDVRPHDFADARSSSIASHANHDASADSRAKPPTVTSASAGHSVVAHGPPVQVASLSRRADQVPDAVSGMAPMQAGAGTLLCHHEPSTTRHDGNAALPATGVCPIVPLPLAPVALPERRAPTADAIETQFGGIFYLLNVTLALGLYGDFTMPRAPGIALSPWDWLALVGLAWFGCDIERDPVWALLADLAGRAADEPPGRHFTPSNIQSSPADWLAPWGGVTRLEVHVERDRLQLWHGAGFVVMDVLLTRGSTPLIQARSLCHQHELLHDARLARLRGAPPRCCLHLPRRRRLARWLRWIVPYLTARLARALATEDLTAVPALVCRHPARLLLHRDQSRRAAVIGDVAGGAAHRRPRPRSRMDSRRRSHGGFSFRVSHESAAARKREDFRLGSVRARGSDRGRAFSPGDLRRDCTSDRGRNALRARRRSGRSPLPCHVCQRDRRATAAPSGVGSTVAAGAGLLGGRPRG